MFKYVRMSAHSRIVVPLIFKDNTTNLVIPLFPLVLISRLIHHDHDGH